MKSLKEEIKETIGESLAELREKSMSNIKVEEIGGKEMSKEIEVREKAMADAFVEYMRVGTVSEKSLTFMQEAVNENGGYTVPKNIFDRILEKAKEYGVMRKYANVQGISVGNSMTFILEDGEFASTWVSELDARPESNAGTFKEVTIDVCEQWAEPKITRMLAKDSMFDLENYIVNKVAEKFGKSEEVAFWKGTGVKQPTGLLNGIVTGDYTGISYTNLNSMIYDLTQDYAVGAKFFMNRKTMKDVKGLVDGNNRPLFIETTDINAKYDGALLGYPVEFTDGLAEGEIVFGDLYNAYGILDKSNDSGMIRDDITEKGKVKFATWQRTGGKTLVREAFKYLKKA